jgi:hypothetical protein
MRLGNVSTNELSCSEAVHSSSLAMIQSSEARPDVSHTTAETNRLVKQGLARSNDFEPEFRFSFFGTDSCAVPDLLVITWINESNQQIVSQKSEIFGIGTLPQSKSTATIDPFQR